MNQTYELPAPGLAAPIVETVGCLAASSILGLLAGVAGYGEVPSWLPLDLASGLADWNLRLLLGSVGFLGGILGIIVSSRSAARALHVAAYRTGFVPARENVGRFRLVEEEGGWGLKLTALPTRVVAFPSRIAGAAPARRGAAKELCFPLDEGTGAELSQLLDPDEELVVQWLDLPAAIGGPTLIRATGRTQQATAIASSEETAGPASAWRRAA